MGKKSGTKAAHYWLMNPAYAEMSNKKLLEDFKRKKKHVLADTNVPEYLENLVNKPMDVAQLIPVPSVGALVPAEPAVNSITATQESQISSTTQVSGTYFIAKISKIFLQVNLCWKHSFLNQITHNTRIMFYKQRFLGLV